MQALLPTPGGRALGQRRLLQICPAHPKKLAQSPQGGLAQVRGRVRRTLWGELGQHEDCVKDRDKETGTGTRLGRRLLRLSQEETKTRTRGW